MKEKMLLPQANKLETVVRVFVYCSIMEDVSIADLAVFCNFEPRQASYYLNACCYLGLVDKNGNITPKGKHILDTYPSPDLGVYESIMSDSLISRVFSHMLLFPNEDIMNYAITIITPLYPEYGDAVIKRRASTLKSWCDQIILYLKNGR